MRSVLCGLTQVEQGLGYRHVNGVGDFDIAVLAVDKRYFPAGDILHHSGVVGDGVPAVVGKRFSQCADGE